MLQEKPFHKVVCFLVVILVFMNTFSIFSSAEGNFNPWDFSPGDFNPSSFNSNDFSPNKIPQENSNLESNKNTTESDKNIHTEENHKVKLSIPLLTLKNLA